MATIVDDRTSPAAPGTPPSAAWTRRDDVEPEPADRGWLAARIPGTLAGMMAGVWYVLFLVALAVEPATDAQPAAIDSILGFALLAGLGATAVGLAARRRFGLVASLGAAGFLTALSIACPTTGHHSLAAWWFVQLACAAGLVVASAVALHRTA